MFSFTRQIRSSGQALTPRHAQRAGALGFARQFNAETIVHPTCEIYQSINNVFDIDIIY